MDNEHITPAKKLTQEEYEAFEFNSRGAARKTSINREEILIMIDMALATGDKKWFNELSETLGRRDDLRQVYNEGKIKLDSRSRRQINHELNHWDAYTLYTVEEQLDDF